MLCDGTVGSVGRDMDAVILYDSGLIHPSISFLSVRGLLYRVGLSLILKTHLQTVDFYVAYIEKVFCKDWF